MNIKEFLIIYKNALISLACFFAVAIITFQVIIPTIFAIASQIQTNQKENKELVQIAASNQTLMNTNALVLEENLKRVVSALPPNKNILAMYQAILNSADATNVAFSGFSVSPGGIYETEGKQEDSIGPATLTLPIKVRVENVSRDSFLLFLTALKNAVPVNEVKSVQITNGSGEIEILFYYKPYNLNEINKNIITPITQSETLILKNLQ